MRRKLLQRTAKAGGLLYVAEMHGGSIHHKMDHLVCFLPGAPCSMQIPSAKAPLTNALLEVGASLLLYMGQLWTLCLQPKIAFQCKRTPYAARIHTKSCVSLQGCTLRFTCMT